MEEKNAEPAHEKEKKKGDDRKEKNRGSVREECFQRRGIIIGGGRKVKKTTAN